MNRMNSILRNGFLASTLLVALSLLTVACSSDDEDQLVPGSTGVIKAQITLSLDNNSSQKHSTRQSEAIVQGQAMPVFRGISDIKLIPFKLSGNETAVSTSSTRYGDNITLKMTNWDDNTIASTANTVKQCYGDIELIIGTDAFLFYGKATETSTDKAVNGSLVASDAISDKGQSLSSITFSLDPIVGTDADYAKCTNLLAYLNGIATAFGAGAATSTDGTLQALYTSFISMEAGSSANIAAAVTQLYQSIKNRSTAPYTTIKTAIANSTYASVDTSTGVVTLVDVDYPRNLHLPDGAACVVWDASGSKFIVQTTNEINGMNFASHSSFVYPASLYYWTNSTIKAAKVSMLEYYESTAEAYDTWAEILAQYDAEGKSDGTAVRQTTKSVALTTSINYAVGRLDYSIQTNDANVTTLLDHEDVAVPLTYNSANSFPVTGIVVGGQKNVDWKFEPTGDNIYFIYDNQVTSGMALTASSPEKSHVLVLETAQATSASDTEHQLNVAIELQNNSGQIFAGKDGLLVYPGTRFYLIGTLDPYTANSNSAAKAFEKDKVTTAIFKVSSLKNAYNTLPDLRLPQLELGLSVDLTWQQGITQTITIE